MDIQWNEVLTEAYLMEVESAVLHILAPQVDATAQALAPVLTRHTPVPKWVKRKRHGHGGALKESVHYEITEDHLGMHADIIALWYGRFLDPKARQLHYKRPFLPTALYTVCAGRVIYLP